MLSVIKRLQLLSNQSLLLEIGTNNDPTGLLPEVRSDLIVLLPLVSLVTPHVVGSIIANLKLKIWNFRLN